MILTLGTPSYTNHHLINRKVEINKMAVSQNLLPPERQGFGQSKRYALECSPIKAENRNTFVLSFVTKMSRSTDLFQISLSSWHISILMVTVTLPHCITEPYSLLTLSCCLYSSLTFCLFCLCPWNGCM